MVPIPKLKNMAWISVNGEIKDTSRAQTFAKTAKTSKNLEMFCSWKFLFLKQKPGLFYFFQVYLKLLKRKSPTYFFSKCNKCFQKSWACQKFRSCTQKTSLEQPLFLYIKESFQKIFHFYIPTMKRQCTNQKFCLKG